MKFYFAFDGLNLRIALTQFFYCQGRQESAEQPPGQQKFRETHESVFEGVQPPGVKHSPLLPQVVNVKE
jgi:hypothetical protein